MSDRLYLDAKVALDGARNLTGAGQHYLNLLTTTGLQLSDQTQRRPWGTDDIGQAFETNYRPVEQQVFEAWGKLADYVMSSARRSRPAWPTTSRPTRSPGRG